MSFPTTNWATLAEATLSGGEPELAALGKFCERYWQPIKTVIRSKGVPADRVDDLTQEFLLKLMKGGFMGKAAKNQGKFRNFLLKALQNFLVDETRKTMAAKRGGGLEHVELKDNTASYFDDARRFDEAWAVAVFDAAVEATAQDVIAKRDQEKWEGFRYFLTGEGEVSSYVELGKILGMGAASAKVEVSRTRAKFRQHLRRQVALTVGAPHEIDEELGFLHEIIIRKSTQQDA